MRRMICFFVRMLLALRYRIELSGLDEVMQKGKGGILLLPSHPALIDPVILLSRIYPRLNYHPLADEDQVGRPVFNALADLFGVVRLPSAVKHGTVSLEGVARALEECGRLLRDGENVMLHPAGHILRQAAEEIGGNSAVEKLLKAAPEARVVVIVTRGLWGSAFSRADGGYPDISLLLRRAVKVLAANLLLFTPRRKVTVRLLEPEDFPRTKDRFAINQYLEKVFNHDLPVNTYVPYYFWERGGMRTMPEPEVRKGSYAPGSVPETIREMVSRKIKEMTGHSNVEPESRLSAQLGMDSLSRLELVVWVEQEFGFHVPNPDMFETVADVSAAAAGQVLADRVAQLSPVPEAWFKAERKIKDKTVDQPQGANIAAAFLAAAARSPGQPVTADQTGGVKTFRDMITAIMVLKPVFEKMPGERLGIMLPASTTAGIVYLAALFAGKTPVMLNWTVGERNINYLVELMGLQRIVTAEKLIVKLNGQGVGFGKAEALFFYLESLSATVKLTTKLSAKLRSYICWKQLDPRRCVDTAVVLFTSGSENLPKAVPLTHTNILTNIRDVLSMEALRRQDVLMGMLPPFHSFGLTLTTILPLLTGIRAVYHPNPTEGGTLARLVRLYRVSILPGTPTFINGILKGALPADLASLRMGVTGAEKCPEYVYKELRELCPDVEILEGYGITECSPVVAVNYPDAAVPFSIGKIVPALEYVIVKEDTLQPCSKGETGMLLVRGASVFSGYLEYSGRSPFVTVDGREYYRTGDLVQEDENGTLYFKGRLKRFIKLGGEMISMPAIEEVLLNEFRAEDDDVPPLAVEALDEDMPELTLFTVRKITREEANDVIRKAGLSTLHNIRRIEHVDEIPLLGTGKTDYRALRGQTK